MKAYRESKSIGNDHIPVRIYDISIDKYRRVEVKSISGFGKEVESEFCAVSASIPHYHSYLEIIQVTEGLAEMQINNTYLTLSSGDIVLIGSNEIHNLYGNCRHKVLNIDPQSIHQIRDSYEDIFPADTAYKWLKANDKNAVYHQVTGNLHQIIELYGNKSKGYSLRIMAEVYELLGFIQEYTETHAHSQGQSTQIKKEDLRRLNKVLDYIDENYSQFITVEDIARVVSLTPNYFCRFFKKSMGKTFFEYLNSYRCAQAEILLHTTELSITEISNKAGFASISYFNKVYKKIKGCTPSKARKFLIL